jgi:hypothetical protein
LKTPARPVSRNSRPKPRDFTARWCENPIRAALERAHSKLSFGNIAEQTRALVLHCPVLQWVAKFYRDTFRPITPASSAIFQSADERVGRPSEAHQCRARPPSGAGTIGRPRKFCPQIRSRRSPQVAANGRKAFIKTNSPFQREFLLPNDTSANGQSGRNLTQRRAGLRLLRSRRGLA